MSMAISLLLVSLPPLSNSLTQLSMLHIEPIYQDCWWLSLGMQRCLSSLGLMELALVNFVPWQKYPTDFPTGLWLQSRCPLNSFRHDIHLKGNLTVYCGFKLGPQATHVERLNIKTLGTLYPGSSNPNSAPRKKITAILNKGMLANLDIKILICDPLDVAVQWVLNTWFAVTHYFCIPKAPIDSLKLPWLHLAGNVVSVAGWQWDIVRVWTHYAHLCPCHDNLQLNSIF